MNFETRSGIFLAACCPALLSYGLSLVAIAAFLMAALHFARLDAFLVAAAFACVSSSVMLPVLQQMNIGTALKTTLVMEGALSDALGVLDVRAVLDFTSTPHEGNRTNVTTLLMRHAVAQGTKSSLAGGVVEGFLLRVEISLALALAVGFVWSRLLPLISEERFWQVLTFAAVLLVYSVSDLVGGSNLFAVIAFGATLANLPGKTRAELEFAGGWRRNPATLIANCSCSIPNWRFWCARFSSYCSA